MQIQIHDFRGVADFDATINDFLLVAGPNGAGKSSVCSAIAACLTGDVLPFDGLTKGKAALLVRDGGASATAIVTGSDGGASVVWPSCERAEKGKTPWASKVAGGLVDPLHLSAKDRAAWLIDLIGALPDSASTIAALGEAGVAHSEATAIWAGIEARGWDAAHAEAKEAGARLKGQWERVTGARYGTAKAAQWRPDGWKSQIDAESVEQLETAAQDADAKVEENRKLLLQDEVKRRDAEAAVQRAQTASVSLSGAQIALDTAANDFKKASEDRAKLGVPVEEVFACPCCGKDVAFIAGKLVKAPANSSDPRLISAADAKRAAAGRSASEADSRLKRLQDEIAAGEKARGILAEMPDLLDPAAVDLLKRAQADTSARLRMKKQALEAGELHERIARQIDVVKLLAEDGLRQQALVAALDTFNAQLLGVTDAAGWKAVTIDGDMSISYGARPVSLCSGGEQYRVRATLQIVCAERDGSDLVILDGADILDRDGRNGLFRAIKSVPALIGMTMRAEDVPEKLLSVGHAVWISDTPQRRAA